MSDCCDARPYQRLFSSRQAERDLRTYRRRGLDPMASSMVSFLKSRDLDGADLLEVGGGIGSIQVELLKAGLAKSVNIELSDGYDEGLRGWRRIRVSRIESRDDAVTSSNIRTTLRPQTLSC